MLAQFPDAQPITGLIGGILIGIAGSIMLLGLGRIAGVSGIAARATGLSGQGISRATAWLFLGGLLAGALAVGALSGGIEARFQPSWPLVVTAGLATGFGTRLGSGCTSGHGVCGVSRLSARSLVATATFIAAGMATVAIANAMGWAW